MGSKVTRLIRSVNLENRAHREIGKAKPRAAPRHPTDIRNPQKEAAAPSITEEIHQKNDPLLSMLKDVYVESKDPVLQGEAAALVKPETQRRTLKLNLPADPYGFFGATDVPKGKLSLLEALTALNNHKHMPKTWTSEKLAEEYSLDPKDAKALIEFFLPFDVKIIPPKTKDPEQIKDT